jgi:hypothetical protein
MCMLFDWQLHPRRQQLSLGRRSRTSLLLLLEHRHEFSCILHRRCIVLPGDASMAPSSPCSLLLLPLCVASLSLALPLHQQIRLARLLHSHHHIHHLDRRYNSPLVLDRLLHHHNRHRHQTVTYHMLMLRRIRRHLEPFWEPAGLMAAFGFDPALRCHLLAYHGLGLEHLGAWTRTERCYFSGRSRCFGRRRLQA